MDKIDRSKLDLKDLTFKEKLNRIEEISTSLVNESQNQEVKIRAVKNLFDIVVKSKDTIGKVEVDFHNPRIEKAFTVMISLFQESMISAGADKALINHTLQKLSLSLIGFEDKMNALTKGLAGDVELSADKMTSLILEGMRKESDIKAVENKSEE